MRICTDTILRRLCDPDVTENPMIAPFEPDCVRVVDGKRVLSFGTSSVGYDVRCADEFFVGTDVFGTVVDPLNFDPASLQHVRGASCQIPPRGVVLTHTLEYFKMPRNVFGLVLGKSSYARCHIHCIATPLEPGWEGQLVLEFVNNNPSPGLLHAFQGCAQILFFEAEEDRDEVIRTSYAERAGKYQKQTGVQLPIL